MKSLINTTNLTRSEIIRERLFECFHNGEVENNQLLEIFIRTGEHLGICTPKIYSKRHGISPQAAHKKENHNLFGCKLIIDAE